MYYLCDKNSFRGDDLNIDLEFNIPEILMDAICYAFCSLSDDELVDKLTAAKFYDSSYGCDSTGTPEITCETEISSDTVDRISVNLYTDSSGMPCSLSVNVKLRNMVLFMMYFSLNANSSMEMCKSYVNRFVIFFLLLGIPVGKVLYPQRDSIVLPLQIDTISMYIPVIFKEFNDDNNNGRLDRGICMDVFNAFIDKIGISKFIDMCHENNYLELLMIAMRLKQHDQISTARFEL